MRLIRNYGCVSQLEGESFEAIKNKTVNLTAAAAGHAVASVYTEYTHYVECLHSRSDALVLKQRCRSGSLVFTAR